MNYMRQAAVCFIWKAPSQYLSEIDQQTKKNWEQQVLVLTVELKTSAQWQTAICDIWFIIEGKSETLVYWTHFRLKLITIWNPHLKLKFNFLLLHTHTINNSTHNSFH